MLVEAVLFEGVHVDKCAVTSRDWAVVDGEVGVNVPHVTAQLLDRVDASVADRTLEPAGVLLKSNGIIVKSN